ncbi:MAG: Druantia anti-phage system protein DruA [Vicinamibacterales bacterium]
MQAAGSTPCTLRVTSEEVTRSPSLAAARLVLQDLAIQGWAIRPGERGAAEVCAPTIEFDATDEKHRVQRQEQVKRDEQLRQPSVRRFVLMMEAPRARGDSFVSIFSLMRDGEELASALEAHVARPEETQLIEVVDPYLQIADTAARCEFTGLRLLDIWRYFRHTWSNQYTSTPGRSLPILIRDRAAPNHPVIGIASIGSAVVQIAERDKWIGWQTSSVLMEMTLEPSLRWARWLTRRIDKWRDEVYIDDLVEDGLFVTADWQQPNLSSIEALRSEADARRRRHQRFGRRADFKAVAYGKTADAWEERARSDLFRSKRCKFLADLLTAKLALQTHLLPTPTKAGLQQALLEDKSRRAISWIIRRARAETVGTEIADITVCGAVAPYNHLIGGKLVSALVASPMVVGEYSKRYSNYASEIASSIAGREIYRPTNLAFLGTTSLYGSGSSQYNRIRIPGSVLASRADIRYVALGRSRSFGPSHLSSASVKALETLAEQSNNGIRVNSIFGEGVSPKFRKVRQGLDILGWPSDQLLRHRRERIVYGVSLVENLRDYLLGHDAHPRFIFDVDFPGDIDRLSEWWRNRWLEPRLRKSEILDQIRAHSVGRPIRHGARVVLPLGSDTEQQAMTFTDDVD